ncbi:sensor histidine kinase [Paraburkholderia madseniana]|jgi:signal transduction histidine kinase|uniref:sensor histidine kinase n=1 Tax=Paraburkholderia TaxID=1822464 RepID=UPI0015C555C4|nr:ATP-binding protein [Paraburkholderia madseniana]NPT69560.1 hypothetical protein [Paraburkholderia madseniana]
MGINMSAHPVSFRWSVGTPDTHHADVTDKMMERPLQGASIAFSSHSPPAAPLTAAALAAAQRGQTLTVQIADRALRIEGDPVRLAQAVNNLLHNAVKYTPEKGCITVNVLADGKDLVVSVKDNGLGISAALLPHIFELFAQSSRTIAASAGGLGVGLAVVKAVAESHGGTVSATSAGPDTGSEFTLRLPIVLERRMAGEPA